jgi:hypothetical protein
MIKGLLLAGLIGTLVSGSQLAAAYWQIFQGRQDIWWTPIQLALPLSEAASHVELHVSGELLQRHLERGSLSARDRNGKEYRVAPQDIKVRLNNWQQIKALKLQGAALAAFLFGSSLTCLGIGLALWLRQRGMQTNGADVS